MLSDVTWSFTKAVGWGGVKDGAILLLEECLSRWNSVPTGLSLSLQGESRLGQVSLAPSPVPGRSKGCSANRCAARLLVLQTRGLKV